MAHFSNRTTFLLILAMLSTVLCLMSTITIEYTEAYRLETITETRTIPDAPIDTVNLASSGDDKYFQSSPDVLELPANESIPRLIIHMNESALIAYTKQLVPNATYFTAKVRVVLQVLGADIKGIEGKYLHIEVSEEYRSDHVEKIVYYGALEPNITTRFEIMVIRWLDDTQAAGSKKVIVGVSFISVEIVAWSEKPHKEDFVVTKLKTKQVIKHLFGDTWYFHEWKGNIPKVKIYKNDSIQACLVFLMVFAWVGFALSWYDNWERQKGDKRGN